MPVKVSYPGVYIEELPSGVHTITGVATSITAFIGPAVRGPVNTPIPINSFVDYDRAFGGLSNSSMMSFAVNDFYQNGGSQGVIVRIAGQDASAAFVNLAPDTAASPAAGPNEDLVLDAANVGAWGKQLGVIVDHKTK